MTALGNDRVLVGARNIATSPTATNVGAAYLLHTNGTLLTTFTNPNPASVPDWYYFGDWFGAAIATLGDNGVLIGARLDGKVYLFTTNGALVQTFSGSPGDGAFFGQAVGAFENGKVLIGAPLAFEDFDTGEIYGAAYLYGTNGVRLRTFTNPGTGPSSGLGFSVAAFGSDRLLIGASGYGPWSACLFHPTARS